jgi:hypothetical protein
MPTVLPRIPFTLCMLATLVAAGLYGGSHVGPLDHEVHRAVGYSTQLVFEGHWQRVMTSLLFTAGGWHFYASLLMLAACVGWVEYHNGVLLVVAVFLGIHLLTLLLEGFAIALPLAAAGLNHGEMLFRARDVGPSAGYYGCLGFAVATSTVKWRPRIASLLLGLLFLRLTWSAYHLHSEGVALSADMAHVVSFPLGLLAGRWLSGFQQYSKALAWHKPRG